MQCCYCGWIDHLIHKVRRPFLLIMFNRDFRFSAFLLCDFDGNVSFYLMESCNGAGSHRVLFFHFSFFKKNA